MPDSDNMCGEMGLTLWTLGGRAFFQDEGRVAGWWTGASCERRWVAAVCLFIYRGIPLAENRCFAGGGRRIHDCSGGHEWLLIKIKPWPRKILSSKSK